MLRRQRLWFVKTTFYLSSLLTLLNCELNHVINKIKAVVSINKACEKVLSIIMSYESYWIIKHFGIILLFKLLNICKIKANFCVFAKEYGLIIKVGVKNYSLICDIKSPLNQYFQLNCTCKGFFVFLFII